jgi:hypothetical protein
MYFEYPQGTILPFDDACPSDWTRVTELDDVFFIGGNNFGTSGGNTSHTHTYDPGSFNTSHGDVHMSDFGDTYLTNRNTHNHAVNIASVTTGSADHIPPYIGVVFCEKD